MNEGRKEDRRGLGGKPGKCGSCHVTMSSACWRSKRSQRNREYIKTSRCCGMQTLSQRCWFFVLYDDQWDPDVSGMSGCLCTCGIFYVAVSSSDNIPPPSTLRIFRLAKFIFLSKEIGMKRVLKSAPNFSLRESKCYVMKVVGRILLDYGVGGLAVILLSIGFQCAGAWIGGGLLCVTLLGLTQVYSVPTCAGYPLMQVLRKSEIDSTERRMIQWLRITNWI